MYRKRREGKRGVTGLNKSQALQYRLGDKSRHVMETEVEDCKIRGGNPPLHFSTFSIHLKGIGN